MESKKVDALNMTMDNPHYVKFINHKSKFEKKEKKRIAKNVDFDSFDYEHSEYFFLCYMTKKYFRDNVIFSLLKLLIGIFSIILLIIINKYMHNLRLGKSFLMCSLLFYGVISIPLSIMYTIANFICYCSYINYVTTSKSNLAKRIIIFYDDDTDKLAAVNLKSVFKRDDYNYREKKRMRGW